MLHPELRQKGAYYVEEEAEEEADCGLLDRCAIEEYARPITTSNRFIALGQKDDMSVGTRPQISVRDNKSVGICPLISVQASCNDNAWKLCAKMRIP